MYSKYLPCSPKSYLKNRKKFIKKISKKNSLALFCANELYVYSADSTLPFQQDRDLFYLSGIDQSHTALILCPYHPNKKYREILFIQESNAHLAVWEGEKLSKEQASSLSGITSVYWYSELESMLTNLSKEVKTFYLNNNEHSRANKTNQTANDRLNLWLNTSFPSHNYERSQPILQVLRSRKNKEEIKQIQKACDITEKGFRRVVSKLKPNCTEYEIEADFIYEFLKNGSKGFAYSPIIASGKNACILHYTHNNSTCKEGEMVLLDVAAEYGNYSSDMTRCLPVSGRFNKRQKEVYLAVLAIKKFAETLLIKGNNFKEYNQEIGDFTSQILIDLKLLNKIDLQNETKENPAYKKYFMHGTSHFLGLDTHDSGDYTQAIKANMVFTIEPGIYIPKEKLGIRLEDNYVVQKQGKPFNLMKNIPLEIEEIEDLMNP